MKVIKFVFLTTLIVFFISGCEFISQPGINDPIIVITFDDADISLFIMGKRDGSTIITDDRPLFFQGISCQLDIFLFPNFLLAMVDRGFLKKNTFFKCYRYWEKIGRYNKAILKEIKQQFHLIS